MKNVYVAAWSDHRTRGRGGRSRAAVLCDSAGTCAGYAADNVSMQRNPRLEDGNRYSMVFDGTSTAWHKLRQVVKGHFGSMTCAITCTMPHTARLQAWLGLLGIAAGMLSMQVSICRCLMYSGLPCGCNQAAAAVTSQRSNGTGYCYCSQGECFRSSWPWYTAG